MEKVSVKALTARGHQGAKKDGGANKTFAFRKVCVSHPRLNMHRPRIVIDELVSEKDGSHVKHHCNQFDQDPIVCLLWNEYTYCLGSQRIVRSSEHILIYIHSCRIHISEF